LNTFCGCIERITAHAHITTRSPTRISSDPAMIFLLDTGTARNRDGIGGRPGRADPYQQRSAMIFPAGSGLPLAPIPPDRLAAMCATTIGPLRR
jgi:hypothetical protein